MNVQLQSSFRCENITGQLQLISLKLNRIYKLVRTTYYIIGSILVQILDFRTNIRFYYKYQVLLQILIRFYDNHSENTDIVLIFRL